MPAFGRERQSASSSHPSDSYPKSASEDLFPHDGRGVDNGDQIHPSHHDSECSESWFALNPAIGTDHASPYSALPPPSNEVDFAGTHRTVPTPQEPIWDEEVFREAELAAERQGFWTGQEGVLHAPMTFDAGNTAMDRARISGAPLQQNYDESYGEGQSQAHILPSSVAMPGLEPSVDEGPVAWEDTSTGQPNLQAFAIATALEPSILEFQRRVSSGAYSCEEPACVGKRWKSLSPLRKHQRKHIPYTEWPEACLTCEQRFLYPKDLARHEPTHLSDEERAAYKVECEVCGKGFTRKDNRDRHQRKHTASEIASYASNESPPSTSRRPGARQTADSGSSSSQQSRRQRANTGPRFDLGSGSSSRRPSSPFSSPVGRRSAAALQPHGLATPPQSCSSSSSPEVKRHRQGSGPDASNHNSSTPWSAVHLSPQQTRPSKSQPNRVMSFGLVTPPASVASSSSSHKQTRTKRHLEPNLDLPIRPQVIPPPTPTPSRRAAGGRF